MVVGFVAHRTWYCNSRSTFLFSSEIDTADLRCVTEYCFLAGVLLHIALDTVTPKVFFSLALKSICDVQQNIAFREIVPSYEEKLSGYSIKVP